MEFEPVITVMASAGLPKPDPPMDTRQGGGLQSREKDILRAM